MEVTTLGKKIIPPGVLPFHDPDKLHCPCPVVAKRIKTGRYAPCPEHFLPEEDPFPYWLFLDDDPSGRRVMVGMAQLGPVHITVGDHCMFADTILTITAIVMWQGGVDDDEIVVEFEGGRRAQLEIACVAQQHYELHHNGDCQGRDTIFE